jgi:hypothetical protein
MGFLARLPDGEEVRASPLVRFSQYALHPKKAEFYIGV